MDDHGIKNAESCGITIERTSCLNVLSDTDMEYEDSNDIISLKYVNAINGVVNKLRINKNIPSLLEDKLKKIKAFVKNPINGGNPAKLKIDARRDKVTPLVYLGKLQDKSAT